MRVEVVWKPVEEYADREKRKPSPQNMFEEMRSRIPAAQA
jgi:hypothetical protein